MGARASHEFLDPGEPGAADLCRQPLAPLLAARRRPAAGAAGAAAKDQPALRRRLRRSRPRGPQDIARWDASDWPSSSPPEAMWGRETMVGMANGGLASGETQVAYTIRRSARRKKTVAVTVDPTGSVDRPATPARAVSRPAALAA